jgi:hypothetical protein
MEPTFAESAAHRGRFIWLLGTVAASVIAFSMLRAAAAPAPRHDDNHYNDYNQYKRVGTCVDGRWVYR